VNLASAIRIFARWLGGSRGAWERSTDARVFDLAHKRDELAVNLAFMSSGGSFARALAAKPGPCCCSTNRQRA
jgi:hypothetical protein